MIGCDRIHSTALRLRHRGGAQTCPQLRIPDEFDQCVRKPTSDPIAFTGEDHAGIAISDVSGELWKITHHRNRATGHRFKRCDG